MGSEGQFEYHFAVYLSDALKDPQVQSTLNETTDFSKNDNVSTKSRKYVRIIEEKI